MAKKPKPIAKTKNRSQTSSQINEEIKEWNEAEKLLDNSITIQIKDDLKYKTYKVLFYKKRIYFQYDIGTNKPNTYEYIKNDKILCHLYSITNEVTIHNTFFIFKINQTRKFIPDRLANLVEYLKGI